jgi:hypothetical protein
MTGVVKGKHFSTCTEGIVADDTGIIVVKMTRFKGCVYTLA